MIKELEKKVNDINFWNDQQLANSIILELNAYKKTVDKVESLKNKLDNKDSELELLNIDNDMDLYNLVKMELNELSKELEEFELITLLNKEYDKDNCVLEIHSGAGGTESCDWANMLYRMYTRWCEKENYKYEVLDNQEGEEVGIKSVSLLIKGEYAYGYLKSEKGVHRLVRLSPFDSNNRRHTSFASIDVTPEFDDTINIEIKEEELKIDVYRSSGAGGQSVNTTDSAVRITHLPTKTVVTCQNERSQLKNKEKAMQVLKSKLYQSEIEKRNKTLLSMKSDHREIEFGSQIRSYVMQPYMMVKDHRTNIETSNVSKVLDGEIDMFIEGYLKGSVNNE